MRPSDDDPDVKAFFRRDDSSSTDPYDAAVMRAAADVLRALDSDRPPTASLELAALMAQGTTRSNPVKTHTRAALTRFAGLGVAAKVMLATGVAIAGAGGAATAVALSTGHLDSHGSSHHGAVHSRSSEDPSPSPSETADDRGGAQTPGSDDTTPEPSQSAEQGEHHGGDDGNADGSNRSPGGPPSASARSGRDHGGGDGNGSPGGPPTSGPSSTSGHGGPGSGDNNSGGNGNGHGGGGDGHGGGGHGGDNGGGGHSGDGGGNGG